MAGPALRATLPGPPLADVCTLGELAALLRALRRREARRRGGSPLTYRQLAATTGWSRGSIGEYFTGNVLPPTDRFDALIRLLGAAPAEQGALASARDRVEEHRRDTPPSTLACPYRGLCAFGEHDAALFFGREELTGRLIDQLGQKPIVALVGPSGSGKSSLVFAGVVSQLKRADWAVADFRPAVGASPLSALAAALLPLLEPHMTEAERLVEIDALQRVLRVRGGLAEVTARVLRQQGATRLLLVVDQFEELYAGGADAAREFVDVLVAPAPGLSVVLTLRTDFLGHALDHAELAQRLQGATLTIGRMTHAQLRLAIEAPLPEQMEYEPGLVERILADVGDEAGCLPLLEFALTMLWARRDERRLTHAAYEELGGVATALAQYAEDLYHHRLEAFEPHVARLFVQLVRPGHGAQPTRRVARRSELDEPLWQVAQTLADTRLVVTGRDDAGTETVELTHEALISGWLRLRQWVDADRDFRCWQERLRGAMEQYEASRHDQGALLRGVPLAEAQRWGGERAADLSPAERGYIRTSRKVQGRANRRLRAFSAGLVLLLLVTSILGFRADQQHRQLQLRERQATSEALAEHADSTIETRPVTSILLSVQAFDQADSVEARGSLLRHVVEHSHTAGFLVGHTSRVSAVAFSPDGRTVATASVDATARLWDVATHRPVATLTGHTNWLRAVAFSPDGRVLATGGDDRTVRLWDVGSHAQLAVLAGHTGPVRAVAFSPDGRVLATGSFDSTVRLWDVGARREVDSLTGHLGWVLGVAFSPDGRTLATAGADHTVRIWDVAGRRTVASLAGHTELVLGVAFGPDGRTVATAGADRTVRVWDVAAHRELLSLTGHGGWVTGVAFSPRGGMLATSSDDLTARLWSVAPLGGSAALAAGAGGVHGMAFSPDSRTLATADHDRTVGLWDVAGTRRRASLSGHTDQVSAVAFSPDGRTLATGSDDRTARLWDAASGRPLAVLTGHTGAVRAVAFSPDGRTLGTASNDSTVGLWDVASGRPLAMLTGHAGHVVNLSFSPDGQTLATAGDDRAVRLWDLTGRRVAGVLTGHTDRVSAVAFDPDGRVLATGGEDATVRLWDVATRREVATLTGHTGWVWTVSFDPGGRTVASAGDDGTVRLWDVASRRELAAITGYSVTEPRAGFSPDGRIFAGQGSDGAVRLWNMDLASWRRGLCELAGRDLTRAEWDEFLPGRPYRATCPEQRPAA